MSKQNTLTEQDVVRWLQHQPDLFVRNPELLDLMTLPHNTGAHSLIEIQVARLRKENSGLKSRLKAFAGIAGENERLMHRLHMLTLDIMSSRRAEDFFARLFTLLERDFDVAAARLHLLSAPDDLGEVAGISVHAPALPDWVENLLERQKIEFGRLTRAMLELLFPRRHKDIASVALVPVGQHGLLALGSDSTDRFQPHMGTLFLELLGKSVEFRLEQLKDDLARKHA